MTAKITIGNAALRISYGSNFNDPYIIQCCSRFTWGYIVEFFNRNEEDIKTLNNSTVAIWRIRERKQLA